MFKAFVYFIWKDEVFMTLHEFKRKLANPLIHNKYLHPEKEEIPSVDERKKSRKKYFQHEDRHKFLTRMKNGTTHPSPCINNLFAEY